MSCLERSPISSISINCLQADWKLHDIRTSITPDFFVRIMAETRAHLKQIENRIRRSIFNLINNLVVE